MKYKLTEELKPENYPRKKSSLIRVYVHAHKSINS